MRRRRWWSKAGGRVLGACNCKGYIFEALLRLLLYSAAPAPKANHVVRGWQGALFFRRKKSTYPVKERCVRFGPWRKKPPSNPRGPSMPLRGLSSGAAIRKHRPTFCPMSRAKEHAGTFRHGKMWILFIMKEKMPTRKRKEIGKRTRRFSSPQPFLSVFLVSQFSGTRAPFVSFSFFGDHVSVCFRRTGRRGDQW